MPVERVETEVTEMGGGIATGTGTLTRRVGEITSYQIRYVRRLHCGH